MAVRTKLRKNRLAGPREMVLSRSFGWRESKPPTPGSTTACGKPATVNGACDLTSSLTNRPECYGVNLCRSLSFFTETAREAPAACWRRRSSSTSAARSNRASAPRPGAQVGGKDCKREEGRNLEGFM
ncbi:unnamed protein product [Urochloa humidicola]